MPIPVKSDKDFENNLLLNATISPATPSDPGSMSAADKTKLDAATSVSTANALIRRDGNRRAKVADGVDNDDIATFGQIDIPVYKVKVSGISDLPTPSGGFYPLADDTFYQIEASFNQGSDAFDLGNKCIIGAELPGLGFVITYTGTNAQFRAIDVNARIRNITVNSGTADFIEAKNTAGNEGTNSIIIEDYTIIDCDFIGKVKDLLFFVMRRGFVASTITGGLTILGTQNKNIILFDNTFASHTGTLFDLGTSVFELLHLDRNEIHYPGGTTFLSGLAASGNVAVGGFGLVTGNNLIDDGGTLLNNIDVNDIRWTFVSKGIELTSIRGELIINTPASTSVLDGTYVKFAGTTTLKIGNRISMSADMQMQYDNLEPSDKVALFSINLNKDSGADKIYDFALFRDGLIISDSEKPGITITTNSSEILLLTVVDTMLTGEQIEARVSGVGTTDNVTANSVNLILS